jgi:hypothetical protein
MARLGFKGVIGACIAGSLMLSSTAAAAASTTAAVQQVNPWGVLTAMSGGAPAAAICGSAAAAAQAPGAGCVLPVVDAVPVPPPAPAAVAPVEPVATGGGISPLVLGLLALAAGVGIYLLVHHTNHANSPA